MQRVQNLAHIDGSLPIELARLDSVGTLDMAQVYSLAHDKAYRHLVRVKMSVALIATLLLLAVSILMLVASA